MMHTKPCSSDPGGLGFVRVCWGCSDWLGYQPTEQQTRKLHHGLHGLQNSFCDLRTISFYSRDMLPSYAFN